MTTLDPTFVDGEAFRSGPVEPISREPRLISAVVDQLGRTAVGEFATGCVVVLAYALTRCDQGIQGDAHIYLGRALADLDPRGVGRDLMFVHDGQSAYSVFGFVARLGVSHIGLAATAQILDAAAVIVWAAAMLALIATLRPGRTFAVVAAATLLLPRWYTPWHGLGAGEAAAIPRPFAESFVIIAFALLARGRPLRCGLLLCCATALHPIMAAPGFAVLLYVLISNDRRWVFGAAGLAAVVLFASALGAPVFDRLFVAIDPAWLSILHERSPYLFVTGWPTDALAIVALQMVTILVASTLVSAPFSVLFQGVVVVALLGGLVSAVGCDGLHLLLFAQAQLWRSFWLGAAMAPLAAGVCLWKLPALGTLGFLAIACLIAGWACYQLQPVGVVFAAFAAALVAAKNARLGEKSCLAIYTVATTAVLFAIAINIEAASVPMADSPVRSISFIWQMTIWPVIVVAFAHATRSFGIRSTYFSALLVVPALLVILACQYDDRSAAKADRDAGRVKTDLTALLASRPGEVLWLGGDELWYWARRPNWSASLQGAGIVFSRDLARVWHERAVALVGHGLASRKYLSPWAEGVVPRPYAYDRAQIDDFCRRMDAPAWIVMPMAADMPAAIDADVRLWTTPLEHAPAKTRLVIPCRETSL